MISEKLVVQRVFMNLLTAGDQLKLCVDREREAALANGKERKDLLRLKVLSVGKCQGNVGGARPEATLATCAKHNITAEAYWTLKNCPFDDPTLAAVAAAHGPQVTTAMVCVAWVLGRGVVVAAGTGSNHSKVAANTREDLGATSLVLSDDELTRVGEAGVRAAIARSRRAERGMLT